MERNLVHTKEKLEEVQKQLDAVKVSEMMLQIYLVVKVYFEAILLLLFSCVWRMFSFKYDVMCWIILVIIITKLLIIIILNLRRKN